jgi:pteridine reductase
MDLREKVVLVTGAGHRVGRAIALALGREGARVAVHYNESRALADEVVEIVRSQGTDARAFGGDLSDSRTPALLAAGVSSHFGALHVLVNSAAVMERTEFDSISVEAWERIMAINFRAPFFLALEAAKFMKESALPASGGGVHNTAGAIVNIGDLAAFETWPDYVVHGLSKAGVDAMTRSLARMLAPDVRVNCVAPGAVLLPENWPAENEREIVKSTPLRRLGRPEDVADAVLYLIGADYVTGETLVVDGGRSIRR